MTREGTAAAKCKKSLRLIDHVFPNRENANTLLMEDVRMMMTCSQVHKVPGPQRAAVYQ